METVEIALWIAGIIAFIFGTTYLLKRSKKAETYYFVSLFRTKRFVPLLDRFTKHKRALNWFADIGLIMGFGAVAIDFLFCRKKQRIERIAIFFASSTALYVLIEVLSARFYFFQMLFQNPFTENWDAVAKISFGVFGLAGTMTIILLAYGLFIVQSILAGKQACPGVAPIIPGVQIPNVPITVPLHAWISFVIILVLHEGMHGVLARKIRLTIKSTGLLLIGLFPVGAFVEPDEKQLQKENEREQARVYAAGPAANLYASMAITLMITVFFLAVTIPIFGGWANEIKQNSVAGVVITGVDQNIDICGEKYANPAFGKLLPGMQILQVNDKNISFQEDVSNELSNNRKKPFTMLLDVNGALLLETITPNELGLVRFEIEEKMNPGYIIPESFKLFSAVSNVLIDFFFWLILLNFLIATVNFLPVVPFDGGKIAKIILLPYFGFLGMNKKETEKFIGRLFLWIVAGLLLLNALPLLL